MRRTITALFMVIGFQSLGFPETDPATLKALRRIDAPQVVGVPPENACRGLMVMPDGEIRHYGVRHNVGDDGDVNQPIYISSRDCGLNWREIPVEGATAAAMARSPWSGEFLTVLCKTGRPSHSMAAATVLPSVDGVGLFAFRSSHGPQGPFTHSLAGVHTGFMARLPLPLRGRRRWVQPIQCRVDGPTQPGVLLSDDDGVTWREVLLPSPPPRSSYRVELSPAAPESQSFALISPPNLSLHSLAAGGRLRRKNRVKD